MASSFVSERAQDLATFALMKAAGRAPFTSGDLAHVYLKLDFKSQFENARTAEDARGFLSSITRAATAAHEVVARYAGMLLEVQGSIIHIGLPVTRGGAKALHTFPGDLHGVLRKLFDDRRARVDGWRMSADAGHTLVVAGRGVHGDDSWVSLGTAANRPAKHLYAQLELPEPLRQLQRFHLGVYDEANRRWLHKHLDEMPTQLLETSQIAEGARRMRPMIKFGDAESFRDGAKAQAAPLGPSGRPGAPTSEVPHRYFGWVMRADLDGFTSRVDRCFGQDAAMRQLAEDFYGIMDTGATFVEEHRETLVQIPWAGDNFTAVAIFNSREAYDRAAPRRLVELSLDFEKDMAEMTESGGFRGWAHGVAGGAVHGNAEGNVYIGAATAGGRRFLTGAGEGFGRSAQAFGDVNPKAAELVLFQPDWERLDAGYKDVFEPAVTRRGEQSSLYRKASCEALRRVRARKVAVGVQTTVTFGPGQARQVSPEPHFR